MLLNLPDANLRTIVMDNFDQILGDDRFSVEDFINEQTWRWAGDRPYQMQSNTGALDSIVRADKPHHKRWLDFDAEYFLQKFDELTQQLQSCYTNQQMRASRLQVDYEELNQRSQKVLKQLAADVDTKHRILQRLDEDFGLESRRLAFLADQVHSVSEPFEHLKSAERLMHCIVELNQIPAHADNALSRVAETIPSLNFALIKTPEQYKETAVFMLKLYRVAKELSSAGIVATFHSASSAAGGPSPTPTLVTDTEQKQNSLYDNARKHIFALYERFQGLLIEEFHGAHKHRPMATDTMCELARVLQPFSSAYAKCVDQFIEESLKGVVFVADIERDIPALVENIEAVIRKVFPAAELVIERVVSTIFLQKLKPQIDKRLMASRVPVSGAAGTTAAQFDYVEIYLQNLFVEYQKAKACGESFRKYKLFRKDRVLLQVFEPYLKTYVADELAFVEARHRKMIQEYYDRTCDQARLPRIMQYMYIPEQRDFFSRISKTPIDDVAENLRERSVAAAGSGGTALFSEEEFLSEELVSNIMHDMRTAVRRISLLCAGINDERDEQVPEVLLRLIAISTHWLLKIHITYAVEIALLTLPTAVDVRSREPPQLRMLPVVHKVANMFHLFAQQVSAYVMPAFRTSTKSRQLHDAVLKARESVETRLNLGLDRVATLVSEWVRHLLQTHQRRDDFTSDTAVPQCTPTCQSVVKYLNKLNAEVGRNLDGENRKSLMCDVALRVHRELYEHIQQFEYSQLGGMIILCDVNEYKECIRQFQVPEAIEYYNMLHSLCSLLMAQPTALQSIADEIAHKFPDCEPILNFVSLRLDHKRSAVDKVIHRFTPARS